MATPSTEPEAVLLTVEEAALLLRIGRTKMFALVSSAAIESVTIGRSRRIPAEAIDAYVATLRSINQPANIAA